jgi:hypothetical protein
MMAHVVADNFDVKFYTKKRKGLVCFYGILRNAQLVAYAFKLAFERTHSAQRNYAVPDGEYDRRRASRKTELTKGHCTANARRNYSLGVVNGLRQKVKQTLAEAAAEKQKRESKLARVRDTCVTLVTPPMPGA